MAGLQGNERPDGHRRHHWSRNGASAPVLSMSRRAPFGVAAASLFNAPTGGLLKALATLFPKAQPYTIRDWRRGKRKAPTWARAILRSELEKRRAEIEHALAILDNG